MGRAVLPLLMQSVLLAGAFGQFRQSTAAGFHVSVSEARGSGKVAAQERTVDAETFDGSDLGAKLRAADAALGGGAGVVRISSPGKLTTAATLGVGHRLRIEAPVSWYSTLALAGTNDVSCSGKGLISVETSAGVGAFRATGATHLNLHDCSFRFASNSPVLVAEGIHSLNMSHVTVAGGSIAQINANHGSDPGGASGDFTFDGDAVQDAPNTGGAALLLVNTVGASITGNTFDGISTGVQWWGGDSAHGNISEVTRAGKLILSGNECHGVTACLWGSMGYAVSVVHNRADGCGDVCFDTEGGLDNNFEDNVASHCGNGCGAIFFFSRNISFRRNDFSGDAKGGGLIFVKNASADPRAHTDFMVAGNKLSCLTVCNAFYQEAVSNATFQENVIQNGMFATAGFGQNISILRNQFTFTRALRPEQAVISGPSITGGTTLTIEGNVITSQVPQSAGAACIRAIWNDYNNTDIYYLRKNSCGGSSPLPIAIVTTTAGTNAGLHAEWHVDDNSLGTGKIVHQKTTPYETYSATGNCISSGCTER